MGTLIGIADEIRLHLVSNQAMWAIRAAQAPGHLYEKVCFAVDSKTSFDALN